MKKIRRHVINSIAILVAGIFVLVGLRTLFLTHAASPLAAPTSPTIVCGQSILNSPYSYNSNTGSTLTSFASGEYSLPTFGSSGTEYPNVTVGYIVPSGNNSSISASSLQSADTIYYFEPGDHTGLVEISPSNNDVYIGGYNAGAGEAEVDGTGLVNKGTFNSTSSNVTIEYLTVANFNGTSTDSDWGGSVVDQDGGDNWTLKYNTVGPNSSTLGQNYAGYGVGVGSDSTYEYNCITGNGEGGFNNGTNIQNPSPFSGPANFTINNNEISGNAISAGYAPSAYDCLNGKNINLDGSTIPTAGASGQNTIAVSSVANESVPTNLTGATVVDTTTTSNVPPDTRVTGISGTGPYTLTLSNNLAGSVTSDTLKFEAWCDPDGVAGGMKIFWGLNGTIDYNYIHDNYGMGIWPDTNNTGFDISNNYISNNMESAISWEADFNVNITNNTISGNGWNPEGMSEWGGWPSGYQTSNGGGSGFADGAIYINNSGGSTNILSGSTRYPGQVNITGNNLSNNFGGIVGFNDRNRFCGEGPDGGQGTCTINGTYSGTRTGTPYYVQPTSFADDATTTSGSTLLTTSGGFLTNYTGATTEPSAGWMVAAFNINTGQQVSGIVPTGDTISSCSSNTSCTLAVAATASVTGGSESGTPIEIAAGPPGGCGMYDLLGSSTGTNTGSPSDPYFDNCDWFVQDLNVSGNTFSMVANPTTTWTSGEVTNCSASTGCGYMNYYASEGVCVSGCLWSPYDGTTSATYITSAEAKNVWKGNTYNWSGSGGWTFEAGNLGNVLTASQWQAAPYNQDAGSVFNNNTSPTVGYTNLSYGQSIYGPSLAIDATATPNNGGSISSCQLKVNGATVGPAITTSPYNFHLDTLSYSDASYSINIFCTDSSANIGGAVTTAYITNGDLDGDGIVGLSDLITLAQNYGKPGTFTYAEGNITGATSGSEVNLSDLIILAQNYGYKY